MTTKSVLERSRRTISSFNIPPPVATQTHKSRGADVSHDACMHSHYCIDTAALGRERRPDSAKRLLSPDERIDCDAERYRSVEHASAQVLRRRPAAE
jgi:hypothetical protein